MTGRVFTSRQAADYCGMAVQTLYNHLSAGTGPKRFKPQGSRQNHFYQSDLDDWNRVRLEEVA